MIKKRSSQIQQRPPFLRLTVCLQNPFFNRINVIILSFSVGPLKVQGPRGTRVRSKKLNNLSVDSPGRIVVFKTVGKFNLLTRGCKFTLTFINQLYPPCIILNYINMIKSIY